MAGLFIKLDTNFWTHPKIVAAGEPAAVLYQRLAMWCMDHATDGVVPNAVLPTFGVTRLSRRLAALTAAELCENRGDSLFLPGYVERYRSAAEIRELRKKRQVSGLQGGRPRKQSETKLVSPGKPNGNQVGLTMRNPDEEEDEDEEQLAPSVTSRAAPEPTLVALADQTIQAATQDPTALADAAQRMAITEALAAGHPASVILAAGQEAANGRHPQALLRAILKRLATDKPEPRPTLNDEHQCELCGGSGWIGGLDETGRPAEVERCPDCTGIPA